MKAFKIEAGDISFDRDKRIIITEGDAETAQALERILTTNAGEWFLDGEHGLEYSKIRGKNVSDEDIEAAIIKAATRDGRVGEVLRVDIKRNEARRHIDVSFVCRLVSGNEISVPFSF